MEETTSVMRRAARVVSVLAVAVLLGHVVQTISNDNKTAEAKPMVAPADPKAVQPVAAGREFASVPQMPPPAATAIDARAPREGGLTSLPPAPMQAATVLSLPEALVPSMMATTPEITLATAGPETVMPKPPLQSLPAPAPRGIIAATDPVPSIVPKSMEGLLRPDADCTSEMDLAALPDAIIEITLLAPCHPSERLVVRQGPLAVTASTTPDGSAFLKIPALSTGGAVTLRFADGSEIKGAIDVPDLAAIRRFAVQWMDDDTFAVNAFEQGASYGEPGHVSAANPGKLPLTGQRDGGYLTILGDAETVPAMLAEVYSYPRNASTPVDVAIEAQVTARTCDRELLGEVILSNAGTATVSDLSLSMPDCSAVGDILVLKHPLEDMTVAAAE